MSGIYIPGMEMPNGGSRTVEIMFDADGYPMALADGGDVFDVIPVPPHGRLIDADALNDLLIKLEDNEYTPKVFASCLSYKENAPTIIPADPEKEEK